MSAAIGSCWATRQSSSRTTMPALTESYPASVIDVSSSRRFVFDKSVSRRGLTKPTEAATGSRRNANPKPRRQLMSHGSDDRRTSAIGRVAFSVVRRAGQKTARHQSGRKLARCSSATLGLHPKKRDTHFTCRCLRLDQRRLSVAERPIVTTRADQTDEDVLAA